MRGGLGPVPSVPSGRRGQKEREKGGAASDGNGSGVALYGNMAAGMGIMAARSGAVRKRRDLWGDLDPKSPPKDRRVSPEDSNVSPQSTSQYSP